MYRRPPRKSYGFVPAQYVNYYSQCSVVLRIVTYIIPGSPGISVVILDTFLTFIFCLRISTNRFGFYRDQNVEIFTVTLHASIIY